MLKNTHCSTAIRAEDRSKQNLEPFTGKVTCQYELKILKRDEKPQTNKNQTNIDRVEDNAISIYDFYGHALA